AWTGSRAATCSSGPCCASSPLAPPTADRDERSERRPPPGDRRSRECGVAQPRLTVGARWAIADLRFTAWVWRMTPLLTALSRARQAERAAVCAAAASPASAASWNLRTAVFRDDFTDLLRSRAASFVRLRLICDLMFATWEPSPVVGEYARVHRAAHADR